MLNNMVDILSYLNTDGSMMSLRVPVPWTKSYSMKKKLNQVMKSSALQKLIDLKADGATFWALSDNELWFITDAADWFDVWSSEEDFKDALTEKINKILKKSWKTYNDYMKERWWDGTEDVTVEETVEEASPSWRGQR